MSEYARNKYARDAKIACLRRALYRLEGRADVWRQLAARAGDPGTRHRYIDRQWFCDKAANRVAEALEPLYEESLDAEWAFNHRY